MYPRKGNELWVTFSLRLYRYLLLVYPSAFRREYGSLMLQVFGDCARAQFSRSGVLGLLTWWGRAMLDTVQTAVEEHSQRGVDMSKEKFEKLSGWALLVGGPLILIGWLAGTRPVYEPHNYFSVWIDQYANVLTMPLVGMGILLLAVGFGGLLARFGAASGVIGRLGLGLGAISGVISAAGVIGSLFSQNEFWWYVFYWGMLFQFTGLALFGLVCLRSRLLPYGNTLPLLAGIWIPLLMVYSMVYEVITGRWLDVPGYVFFGLWLISLIGLTGIGLLLQRETGAGGAVSKAAV
jgi:hypothetical protein